MEPVGDMYCLSKPFRMLVILGGGGGGGVQFFFFNFENLNKISESKVINLLCWHSHYFHENEGKTWFSNKKVPLFGFADMSSTIATNDSLPLASQNPSKVPQQLHSRTFVARKNKVSLKEVASPLSEVDDYHLVLYQQQVQIITIMYINPPRSEPRRVGISPISAAVREARRRCQGILFFYRFCYLLC